MTIERAVAPQAQLPQRVNDMVAAVRSLTAERGYPPTLQEVADRLNLSRGRVDALVTAGRLAGIVAQDRRIPRSLRVTD